MDEQAGKQEKTLTLSQRFAARYGVDPKQLFQVLKATAFKQREGVQITDAQMMALIIVADQYGLNPFTREIYAYPDKNGGIVPVVGVDGWVRMAQKTEELDGIEFEYSDKVVKMPEAKPCPEWCEAIVYRKNVAKPIRVREYLDEVFQDRNFINPWRTHTKRMLRHKALIQALRAAFGYAGIYDEDEAERVVEAQDAKYEVVDDVPQPTAKPIEKPTPVEPVTDEMFTDVEETTQKPDSPITEAQRKRLFAIASKVEMSNEALHEWLKQDYGIEHTTEIKKSQYDEIIKKLSEFNA
jgi:phage recombination protein Bet